MIMLLLIGLLAGANIVPQQDRLIAAGGDVAVVALGLNGSAIYVGIALGGAVGGVTIKVQASRGSNQRKSRGRGDARKVTDRDHVPAGRSEGTLLAAIISCPEAVPSEFN